MTAARELVCRQKENTCKLNDETKRIIEKMRQIFKQKRFYNFTKVNEKGGNIGSKQSP